LSSSAILYAAAPTPAPIVVPTPGMAEPITAPAAIPAGLPITAPEPEINF